MELITENIPAATFFLALYIALFGTFAACLWASQEDG